MKAKSAELAQAEQRFQQAREAEASAQRTVASSRRDVEQATARHAEVEGMIRALGEDRDRLAGEVQRAEQARKEVHAQLARLTEDMAARTKELAGIEGQVQAARNELADTQAKLAEARQQLSAPPPARPSGEPLRQ
jgi:chromosome segregation ATPase